MPELRIEWDQAKNRENVRKHRVSFEEAATAFYDERALLLADPTTPMRKIGSFCSGSAPRFGSSLCAIAIGVRTK